MEILDLCLTFFILSSDKFWHIVPQVMHYYIVQFYKPLNHLLCYSGKYHYTGIETSHRVDVLLK